MHQTTRRALEELQSTFARVAASFQELIAVQREAESHNFDGCPVSLRPFRLFKHDPARTFGHMARRTADEVVDVVRRELAGGRVLALDGHKQIVARFFQDEALTVPSEGFCCVQLGQAIYEAFAESAATMALRQAADRVVELFGLSAGEEPVQRKAFVVLNLRMYVDRWGGRLSYSNDRTLIDACYALNDVVTAIDADAACAMPPAIARLVNVGRMNHWAPERYAYGPVGPVAIRAYQNKVEFLVPVDLAARINGFLTAHASAFRAQARAAA